MRIIKGFVTITDYIDNRLNTISNIGELSTLATTYSNNKGEYSHALNPEYCLVTFKTIDNTGYISLSTNIVADIITVISVLNNYSKNNPNSSKIKSNVINTINDITSIVTNDLKIGNLISVSSTNINSAHMPEWISWNTGISNTDYSIRIWLSDKAFTSQYDDYEIVIVPPVDTISDLLSTYGSAVTSINSRSISEFSDKIQIAKNQNPETFLRLLDFDFYKIITPSVNASTIPDKIKTNWAAIIYGRAGDTIDLIKDAIIVYIQKNLGNNFNPVDWMMRLPELFKRTEFVLFPRWDKPAVLDQNDEISLYSSLLNPNECFNFVKSIILHNSGYTEAWITGNTYIFPYDYKAITIVAVNGYNNMPEKSNLKTVYSDYIPFPSTDIEFNRMSLATRELIILLGEMLVTAEVATQYTNIPPNLRRIIRNDNLYITATLDGANFVMAAKSNSFYSNGA